jgi:hypothetical protein
MDRETGCFEVNEQLDYDNEIKTIYQTIFKKLFHVET